LRVFIHANLINAGIIPLTFADESDYDLIGQGDLLSLPDIKQDIENSDTTVLEDKTTGRKIKLNITLSKRQREIIVAGGLLNYTKASK
jgi:aconitate hydratase